MMELPQQAMAVNRKHFANSYCPMKKIQGESAPLFIMNQKII